VGRNKEISGELRISFHKRF